jgi:hypothetical protein
MKSYLEKTLHKKIGLVEWLKVKALSSSTSTAKKKKATRECAFINNFLGNKIPLTLTE